MGLIVHLARTETLWDEAAELIRKPFAEFPDLRDSPVAGIVTRRAVRHQHPAQIAKAVALIRSLAPDVTIRELLVNDRPGPDAEFEMSVEIFLDTGTGKLTVADDYGEPTVVDLST
jgi:hypothetical protein